MTFWLGGEWKRSQFARQERTNASAAKWKTEKSIRNNKSFNRKTKGRREDNTRI
jgi:hypothetical protein